MIGGHWWELLIILGIVILVFGPNRLGDVGGALGKSIREFRKSAQGDDESADGTNPPSSR